MSRNGSGIYSLPAGNPVTSGTAISSTIQNNTMSDIATAITGSLASDGQTVPTANLPMGGFKHTGAANGSAATDYSTVAQLQGSSISQLSSVSGADTITATATPAPAAYAAGQCFSFISAGANTTAVTLNISSLGAKAVTLRGATALLAGNIVSGQLVTVEYDGTRFQLLNPATLLLSGGTVAGAVTVSGALTASSTAAITGAVSMSSTLGVTGAITPSQTNGIVGTTTNNDANAGSVGEFVISSVAVGSAVSLVTTVSKNVTSISLTAGDWDVRGQILARGTSTTNFNTLQGCSSQISASPDLTRQFYHVAAPFVPGATFDIGFAIPTTRFSLSGTTTIYLVANASFSVSTLGAWGFISARRVR